ncbi:Reprolysin domain containing protein [Trichuris trichiura]|uniref:Reprolysin domain containing protein n=1 Tax=Trichuris trichiura TaxID=36087 RepID=A0A077ZC68_TRITR|nr:Reprolysin domain containing protein [Trichuris trichiura]
MHADSSLLLLLYFAAFSINATQPFVHLFDQAIFGQHLFTIDSSSGVAPFNLIRLLMPKGRGQWINASMEHGGKTYHFLLKRRTDLFDRHFHEMNKNHLPERSVFYDDFYSCLYDGYALHDANVRIAIAGCHSSKRGLLAMADGSFLLIEPISPIARRKLQEFGSRVDGLHTLRKRDTGGIYQPSEHKCLHSFDTLRRKDSRPNRLQTGPLKAEEFASTSGGSLVIETALFVDARTWQRFVKVYGEKSADKELLSFVVAVVHNVNALFRHPTIVPKLRMQIKKYEVLKRTPPELADHTHAHGEAELLLKAFCNFQEKKNVPYDNDPRHWDHAILFTGHDIYSNGLKAVAGFAPVGGMCNPFKSCTINEGVDFGCVFVIAHEMGHSLGMMHDGDNGCNAQCCIMSPFVGDGKTSWSPCSVAEMNKFLRHLSKQWPNKHCLMDEDDYDDHMVKKLEASVDKLPGQMYTVDQQCKLVHGKAWSHMLQSGQSPGDVCKMVWCSAGEGVIRNSHPALEGTYCGYMKWCLEGTCQIWKGGSMPVPVNGNWAQWEEHMDEQCSQCKIDRQLRVRLSQRLCTNPPANNGGKECVGSEYRATVCNDTVCSGYSPDEFATATCAKWQVTFRTILSGVGLQHSVHSCKIWCHVRNSDYAHAIGNFPDGTPCNGGGHCVRGKCMV